MGDVWPDEKLEQVMRTDAALAVRFTPVLRRTAVQDCVCHIDALLERVRALEAKVRIAEDTFTALEALAQSEIVERIASEAIAKMEKANADV